METINPVVFIVVGVVLFIGLFILAFWYLLKRRTKKRLLKEVVSKVLLRVETNESKRSPLWTRYRLLLSKLAYKPTRIDEELASLDFPVEKETARLRDFFSLKPRGFWKLYAGFFYEPHLIPDRFLKPPRMTIRGLGKKLIRLGKDKHMQDAKLKDKGLLLQLFGCAVLIGGLHGFNIFTGLPHFIVIGISLVIFALCLSKGGSLVRESKKG